MLLRATDTQKSSIFDLFDQGVAFVFFLNALKARKLYRL